MVKGTGKHSGFIEGEEVKKSVSVFHIEEKITLNSWHDITHRPCCESPIEFQQYRSVRVAAIYSFKEQSARCGVSDCLQVHRQGLLVIISDEKETNLCEACGQRFSI